jgi:hypothetical protein
MANKGTRGWGDFRCDDVGERRKTKEHKKVPPPQVMYLPFTTLFVSEVSSNEVLPLTEAEEKGQSASVNGSTSFDETSETNKVVNGKYMTWGGGLLSPTSSHLKSPQPLVPLLAIK